MLLLCAFLQARRPSKCSVAKLSATLAVSKRLSSPRPSKTTTKLLHLSALCQDYIFIALCLMLQSLRLVCSHNRGFPYICSILHIAPRNYNK